MGTAPAAPHTLYRPPTQSQNLFSRDHFRYMHRIYKIEHNATSAIPKEIILCINPEFLHILSG